MISCITSTSNAQIKFIRRLQQRKERERSGLFVVEGEAPLCAALQQNWPIERLVVAPDLLPSRQCRLLVAELRESGVACLEVTPQVFASLGVKETARGLCAILPQCWERLDHIVPAPGDCWVVLESIQYPGNIGTILRTCDAVGGSGIILLDQTADPYEPAAVRASTGSLLALRLVRSNSQRFAAWKRRQALPLIGASPAGVLDYRQACYQRPLLLAFGSERAGLSAELQSICDLLVAIPMAGAANSLNVAVAAGVVLYEMFRAQSNLLEAQAR